MQFFHHFWKNMQDIIFPTMYIFAYLPPSAINRDQNRTFIIFLLHNLLFRQINFVYLLKNLNHQNWFMTNSVTFPKKYLFMKTSLHNLFQSKLVIYTQKQQLYIFWGQFYLKGEGQRFLEHPGLTPWPKNFRKK